MAKKSKDARSYIKLVSSESDHCYYVQKNRNNTKGRLNRESTTDHPKTRSVQGKQVKACHAYSSQ
jgi:hypothetical protein